MVSLDPDDFLVDLPAHPHPSFPDKQAEEEELEWLSNKDSFPSVEMCILPQGPPAPPKSLANVEQAQQAIPLPETPNVEKKDDENGKTKFKRVCTFCGVVQTLQRVPGVCNVCGFSYKSGRTSCAGEESPKGHSIEGEKVTRLKGVCTHCGVTHSPQWRMGPRGKKTLCNACGLRYISGRLYPEYRPANSPTFSQELHSNKHRRILEKRNQILEIKGSAVNPVDKCTNSETTLSVGKMKKNSFPIVATGKIVEQLSRGLIVEEQSPISVLKNNTNGGANPVPHQPPNNALTQQHLFADQLNDKNSQEDTAKVKNAINHTILMISHEPVKMSYKVPSDALEQQLFSCEPTNKQRKRNTVNLRNEKHIATQMSTCEKLEQPQQLTSEFLEHLQLFNDQPINNCSSKLTAKEGKTLKAVEISGTNTVFLGNSKLCIDTSNITEQPLVTAIVEQQTPASVFKSIINSSMALVNSSKPINNVNQALSESLVQYNQLCDTAKYKPKEIDGPTVETERNSSTLMQSSVTLELTNLAPNELLEQQQEEEICNQAYNNANKKDTVRLRSEGNNTTFTSHSENSEPLHQARMRFLGQEQVSHNKANNETSKEDTVKIESEGKCQDCGDEQSPRWVGVPLGPKTLCNSCGLARRAALQQKSIALEVGEKPYTLPSGKSTNLTYTLPIHDEFYFTLKPSDTTDTEHQNLSSGLEARRYNSMDLMSSCRVKFPHRVRSKGLYKKRSTIPGQRVQIGANCMNCSKQTNRWRMGPHGPTTLCNVCGNGYQPLQGINSVAENIAKVCQHCESEEATEWLTCLVGPKALCSSCYHWFKYFCNQTNNISDRKARTEVDTGRKCHNCGAKATPLWRSGPMGAKTLCNACGIRWHKFGDLCRQPLK